MLVSSSQTDKSSLLSEALELVWPTRCAGCERPGVLLCEECASALGFIDQSHACACCGAPYGAVVCTECYSSRGKETFAFAKASCAITLGETSGRVIVLYKDESERRLAAHLARLLMSTLPASWFGWADLITWIPADKKALRRRGFDHMEHIASELARATGIPARKLLVKKASRDQRSLNLSQRKSNLAGSFTPAISDGLLPPHVLLVDDVFTTGATLDAAASALREGGTHEVRAACIARAW